MLSRATRPRRSLGMIILLTAVLAGCGGPADRPAPTAEVSAPTGCSGAAAPTYPGAGTAFDSPVSTRDQSAVATQVSAPTMSAAASGSSSYRIASVHVSAQVVANGTFAVSPASLVLTDQNGKACPRPAANPLPDMLGLTTIAENRGVNGNVAFLVPVDADLADYSVVYQADPTDARALAKWSRLGTAPRRTVANSCDGSRITYDRKGVATVPFGRTAANVTDKIGTSAESEAPRPRTLTASSTVPGDVDGIGVSVRISATGADAYVDRRQFVLLDGQGLSCRFGSLPSPGENLTNALIKSGMSATYTLIFWVPKGAIPNSWTLLQLSSPTSKKAVAAWATSSK